MLIKGMRTIVIFVSSTEEGCSGPTLPYPNHDFIAEHRDLAPHQIREGRYIPKFIDGNFKLYRNVCSWHINSPPAFTRV